MDNVRIKRVGYDLSIYDRIKQLIPIGENLVRLSEDEHLSRLSNPPPASGQFDYESFISQIEKLKATDAQNLFSIAVPKPNSARVTIVFDDPEDINIASIRILRKRADPLVEIYVGSKSFDFGIFVTPDEIAIWENDG